MRMPHGRPVAGRAGAMPELPAWVRPSAKLTRGDRGRYAGLLAGLLRRLAAPRRKDLSDAIDVASCEALRDLSVMAARRGIAWRRFETGVMDGDLAGVFGESDLHEMIARLTGSGPEGPPALAALDRAVEARKSKWVCGAGCWMCCACSIGMTVLPAEVRAVWSAIKDLPEWKPVHPAACPALGPDGACRAYEVRPAICRRTGSEDLDRCRTALAEFESGEEPKPFLKVVTWPLDPWRFCLTLRKLTGAELRHVDLRASLEALKGGAGMDEALSAGRARYLELSPEDPSQPQPAG